MELQERLINVEQAVKMVGLTTKEVLTFNEAVQFTGMAKSYLYKLTASQRVPHYKPNGKLCYFSRTELEGWLLQNRVSTIDEIESQAVAFCMKRGGKL